MTQTDLRFFTNEPNETLYHRFVQTLRDAQYFDVLVGYFRTSGFRRLYASLEGVEKTRILIGLSVGMGTCRATEHVRATMLKQKAAATDPSKRACVEQEIAEADESC